MIKEAKGDVAQGTQDVLGSGAQSTGEGVGSLGAVAGMGNGGGMRSVQGEREYVELGFQRDVAAQVISQYRKELNPVVQETGFV
jgi:hypothetical protein